MKKAILVFALAAALTLMGSGIALAATGLNIPHGGYSVSTDACLQCHDVHEAAGDYVLMRWATVTNVCGTCHGIYNQQPTSKLTTADPTQNPGGSLAVRVNYNPGYSGDEAALPGLDAAANQTTSGAASPYAVYQLVSGESDTGRDGISAATAQNHNGHRLGTAMAGLGNFSHGDGVVAGADYIPGGSGGLTAIRQAVYPMTVPATSYTATNGLYCASCHTPHGEFGQMVPSTISSKILSSKPNHVSTPAAFSTGPSGGWVAEGGREYCGKCHDKRISGQPGIHTHPDSACLSCHGNYVGSVYNAGYDFPHTSDVPRLLTLEPDGLCIQCHTNGALP